MTIVEGPIHEMFIVKEQLLIAKSAWTLFPKKVNMKKVHITKHTTEDHKTNLCFISGTVSGTIAGLLGLWASGAYKPIAKALYLVQINGVPVWVMTDNREETAAMDNLIRKQDQAEWDRQYNQMLDRY